MKNGIIFLGFVLSFSEKKETVSWESIYEIVCLPEFSVSKAIGSSRWRETVHKPNNPSGSHHLNRLRPVLSRTIFSNVLCHKETL